MLNTYLRLTYVKSLTAAIPATRTPADATREVVIVLDVLLDAPTLFSIDLIGMIEGSYDGNSEGANDGVDEGIDEGIDEGSDDGGNDGSDEGFTEGALDGGIDGDNDGLFVG